MFGVPQRSFLVHSPTPCVPGKRAIDEERPPLSLDAKEQHAHAREEPTGFHARASHFLTQDAAACLGALFISANTLTSLCRVILIFLAFSELFPPMASTLEAEIAFLLSVAAHLGHSSEHVGENEGVAGGAPPVSSLTASEREVLAELLLLEKKESDYVFATRADTAAAGGVEALLAESPLTAMYRGEAVSPYTRFILSFYSSTLYAQVPTKVNTIAIRLFQRFLCGCRGDALQRLHHGFGRRSMEVVLRECLNLAGNLSSTLQIAAPSEMTGLVIAELDYDAQEVSPLDYLDVILPHISYLSQMCQQASLLLLAHEEMMRQPSSLVALFTIVFTIRNMGTGDDTVTLLLSSWPECRQAAFYRMNAFLNCFT